MYIVFLQIVLDKSISSDIFYYYVTYVLFDRLANSTLYKIS